MEYESTDERDNTFHVPGQVAQLIVHTDITVAKSLTEDGQSEGSVIGKSGGNIELAWHTADVDMLRVEYQTGRLYTIKESAEPTSMSKSRTMNHTAEARMEAASTQFLFSVNKPEDKIIKWADFIDTTTSNGFPIPKTFYKPQAAVTQSKVSEFSGPRLELLVEGTANVEYVPGRQCGKATKLARQARAVQPNELKPRKHVRHAKRIKLDEIVIKRVHNQSMKKEQVKHKRGSRSQIGHRILKVRTLVPAVQQPVARPVQHTTASSSCVYDGGGQRSQRAVETQVNASLGTVKKIINDVTYQLYCAEWKQRYRLIHADKLKLCTAATPSQDSVATQPTTY